MIAETLRKDLAAARLERDAAQREVAELRESIARDIEALPCIVVGCGLGSSHACAIRVGTAAAIARGPR